MDLEGKLCYTLYSVGDSFLTNTISSRLFPPSDPGAEMIHY